MPEPVSPSTLCREIPEARRVARVRSCHVNMLLNRDGRTDAPDGAGQKGVWP